jgi:outer membrane phospholipase A
MTIFIFLSLTFLAGSFKAGLCKTKYNLSTKVTINNQLKYLNSDVRSIWHSFHIFGFEIRYKELEIGKSRREKKFKLDFQRLSARQRRLFLNTIKGKKI